MADWREDILKKLPRAHLINIVFDPDSLLNDLLLQSQLREKGFEVLLLKDRMDLRYQYEAMYRHKIESGEDINLLIIVPGPTSEGKNVPWDLLKNAYKQEFTARDLTPSFYYGVTSRLPIYILDKLYGSYRGRALNELETLNKILLLVYDVDETNIRNDVDFLTALIKLHAHGEDIPDIILNHLEIELKKKTYLGDPPIRQFLTSKSSLMDHIQTLWSQFIKNLSSGQPLSIDLGSDKIRKEIIQLFIEGQLEPVKTWDSENLPSWVRVGIDGSAESTSRHLLPPLLNSISIQLEEAKTHRDWQRIALLWADAINHHDRIEDEESGDLGTFKALHIQVERKFTQWAIQNYAALYSLRLNTPVTVSQITDYLSLSMKENEKAALLVIDGLALDQWLTIKNKISKITPKKFQFNESTVYAAIPTLTSISRQSIFSGKDPFHIEEYLESPREEQLWKKYWNEKNIASSLIKSFKLTTHEEVELILRKATDPALGIVLSFVDESVHGSTLNRAALTSLLEKWIEQKHLTRLIEGLQRKGYTVYLTSDHGNIESTGQGTMRQGSLVEQPGLRARIYRNHEFAYEFQQKYPESLKWMNSKNSEYIYLLATERGAFAKEGEIIVTHGGITLEEVIVPFVEVKTGE